AACSSSPGSPSPAEPGAEADEEGRPIACARSGNPPVSAEDVCVLAKVHDNRPAPASPFPVGDRPPGLRRGTAPVGGAARDSLHLSQRHPLADTLGVRLCHPGLPKQGAGEPILEGRAATCVAAVREIEPYLVGKDPRRVVHHWQAIYRHAFYRGGPILTSALSGIDQALWDIKGKAPGVPGYELLRRPPPRRLRAS